MNTLKKHPYIAWFADNSVVANILMSLIIVAGIATAFSIRKEAFPPFSAESVDITTVVRGGTPENVERGITTKIEEALQSVKGVEHIRSSSTENSSKVTVEAKEGYDINRLFNDIKIEVDAISTLPEQAESPKLTMHENTPGAAWVEIYGNLTQGERNELARTLKDDLLSHKNISLVTIYGKRDYEISIEPSEEKLRAYNLTFNEVANTIAKNSLDLGAGNILSKRGNISLQSRNQSYVKKDFEHIVLRTEKDGTRIFLKDVASIRDAFIDQQYLNTFNGYPTISLQISTQGDDDIIKAVKATKEVVQRFKKNLPPGASITVWNDGSTSIRDRLRLLINNGLLGILLVLANLMLFLNFRLAFWVAAGIPICLCGTLACFIIPGIDLTLNLISAFGFLVVLGILVDDAIVIGESIFDEKQKVEHSNEGKTALITTVRGVSKVVTPATFGVITTIATFAPLTMISGRMGNVLGQMALVIVICLIFSLIESKIILPSHLCHLNVHQQPTNAFSRGWVRFQGIFICALSFIIRRVYTPLLHLAMQWRYVTLSLFLMLFITVIALFPAGQLRFVFFPNIYIDNITANLELEEGLSVNYLHACSQRISQSAIQLGKSYKKRYNHNPFIGIQIASSSDNASSIVIELSPSSQRDFLPTEKIIADWRKAIGPIAGTKSFMLAARAGPPNGDISIQLASNNNQTLIEASNILKKALATQIGTSEIEDSFDAGKPEIVYEITPQGQAAGFNRSDLSTSIRSAFYGIEAQRIQRGRDEVRVMVRYPKKERENIETLREMRVRKADGSTLPFSSIASTHYSASPSSIAHYDNNRIIRVEATVDKAITSPDDIMQKLRESVFPQLQERFNDLKIIEGGEAEQRGKSESSLKIACLISLLLLYVLIAIPLKSYGQPLMIMSVIPFGLIGAFVGHYLMGIPVSMLSLFGLLALSGVVVNDSLVLVCAVNDARTAGLDLYTAAFQSAISRFRAILLTSMTTFLGLAPLLLETETQAQFLKPMAASLAFGILFTTFVTLFLLPCLFIIVQEIKELFWNISKEKKLAK